MTINLRRAKSATRRAALLLALCLVLLLRTGHASADTLPLQQARQAGHEQYVQLMQRVDQAFGKLQPQVIKPAQGYLAHPYLIPAGYYQDMWDWDGFFIGYHLENAGQPQYLKWWVLNFAKAVDDKGYVAGRITTQGPSPVFGTFTIKPFLAQGALLAAQGLDDYAWIVPIYAKLKRVIEYRETVAFDTHYGLFYWENAGESGADNSVVLSNDPKRENSIIAADMNTWQLREYLAMSHIAGKLGHRRDETMYQVKAAKLRRNMLKYLWYPADESFWNIVRSTGKPVKRVSFQNFVPLIQGIVPKQDGRAMIKRYLWNEQYMLTAYGLRSLSVQDPDYTNQNMIVPYSNWRGPIWIVANYLYAVALKRYGFAPEARQLAYMMGELTLNDIRENGTMHEDYDADTGAPLAPTPRQSRGHLLGFVGWDLLVQDMLHGAVSGQWPELSLSDHDAGIQRTDEPPRATAQSVGLPESAFAQCHARRSGCASVLKVIALKSSAAGLNSRVVGVPEWF